MTTLTCDWPDGCSDPVWPPIGGRRSPAWPRRTSFRTTAGRMVFCRGLKLQPVERPIWGRPRVGIRPRDDLDTAQNTELTPTKKEKLRKLSWVKYFPLKWLWIASLIPGPYYYIWSIFDPNVLKVLILFNSAELFGRPSPSPSPRTSLKSADSDFENTSDSDSDSACLFVYAFIYCKEVNISHKNTEISTFSFLKSYYSLYKPHAQISTIVKTS
jgi:hypothetical protein